MNENAESTSLSKHFGITGSTLKWIAIISMAIDHTGAAVLGRIIMRENLFDQQNWTLAQQHLYQIYNIMRFIGRIAFPIFCFLLVEGFMHTHNQKKYLIRLGIFALISDIPFDLAFQGKIFDWGHQNVFFTLLLGLLLMNVLDFFEKKEIKTWQLKLLTLAGIAITAVLAELLHTDYGAIGILCIMVQYIFRFSRIGQLIAGAVSFVWELTAPLAFIPIAFYNGRRGMKMKYFFYVFYPAHLLLLYGISCYMGMGKLAGF